MDREQKFWLTLWLGLGFLVVSLMIGVLYFDKSKTIEMAKLGYEKTTVVGHSGALYQKRGD